MMAQAKPGVWSLSLDELTKVTKGQTLNPNFQQVTREFFGVGTDTRKDLQGQVFFALKGETFDSNLMLEKAVGARAAAVVTHNREKAEELVAKSGQAVTVVFVEDTLKALQALG